MARFFLGSCVVLNGVVVTSNSDILQKLKQDEEHWIPRLLKFKKNNLSGGDPYSTQKV